VSHKIYIKKEDFYKGSKQNSTRYDDDDDDDDDINLRPGKTSYRVQSDLPKGIGTC
jgi:hypothetical protein